MTALDHSSNQNMLLLAIDKQMAEQLTGFTAIPITHLHIAAFPSKPHEQRIVFQLSTEHEVDPATPTITFAMSSAAAQVISEKLISAIKEADGER